MSQGSKKKKGIALALVLLLVMSALAVVVFGKGYIRNKNRGRSPHVISASSAEQIAERIISETSLAGIVKLQMSKSAITTACLSQLLRIQRYTKAHRRCQRMKSRCSG